MKDRIQKIIENENLTPAKFADRLHINRAVVSHILNGRNNPSLDVISKILSEMDYINPDWLINGIGEMHRQDVVVRSNRPFENDLFNQPSNISNKTEEYSQPIERESFKAPQKQAQSIDNDEIISRKVCQKK